MEKNNIHIAAIQETHLGEKSKQLDTRDYKEKDRGKKGGGLAFLVHKSIAFNELPEPNILKNDSHLESHTISIPGHNNSELQIRNIYIPPAASCQNQYNPPMNNIFDNLNETSVIVGDFNAHHTHWLSEGNTDTRGRNLADILTEHPFGILNEDLPTRVTASASTSPDISLASNSLLSSCNWSTEVKLSSDHLPITISLTADIKKHKSRDTIYINFSKANWEQFTAYTEEIFENAYHTGNVHKDESYFRKVLNKASKKYIPSGRIMKVNGLPTEADEKIEQRNNIRENNPADPRIPELNESIKTTIKKHKQNKWTEHLASCKAGSKKLWSTIKSLENKPRPSENQGIIFDNKTINNPKKIANKFNSQYTNHSNSSIVAT